MLCILLRRISCAVKNRRWRSLRTTTECRRPHERWGLPSRGALDREPPRWTVRREFWAPTFTRGAVSSRPWSWGIKVRQNHLRELAPASDRPQNARLHGRSSVRPANALDELLTLSPRVAQL